MPGGFGSDLDSSPCPCGGGAYSRCCGPLHRREQRAETAEQLMRSRYSAFAWRHQLPAGHPSRAGCFRAAAAPFSGASARQTQWLGLSVLHVTGGRPKDLAGTVQFEARYHGGVLKETSLFQRRNGCADGDWLYVGALKLEA